MARPWLPSPSHTSFQSLEDDFSRVSLSGSGLASQFPNLPTANHNLDFQNQSLPDPTSWQWDEYGPLMDNRVNEVNPNFHPGSSSYSPYPNLVNNNIPRLGLGYGYGSGSGSGSGLGYGYGSDSGSSSGFVSPSDYPAMLPRNGLRPSVLGSDDLEYLRRRINGLHYNNSNSLMNNISNNHRFLTDEQCYNILTSLLERLNENRTHGTRPHHHNHRHYNNNNNSRRPTTTWNARNRGHNYGYGGGANGSTAVMNMAYLTSSWDEIRGKVVDYATDKNLSQIIIKKFELGHMEGVKMVVSEVKLGITHILFNQPGSQFFQKFLDILDHQDIVELLRAVMANQQDFIHICLDSQGTRAVQKLLKHLNPNNGEEKVLVLNSIRGYVVSLAKNMNGYHYLMEALRTFKDVYEVAGPILNEIADHCVDIAMDKSGCCMLQQCIHHEGPERDRIIHEIITHAVELSENDYGNYVVQFVVSLENEPYIMSQVIRTLEGSFTYLSKSKFASHVVEKLLRESDEEHANLIIKEIFDENDPNMFLEIVQHPNGNFVAQTVLDVTKEMHRLHGSKSSTYLRLVERIEANYAFLHSHMFGKKVLSHVKFNKGRV